MIKRIVFVLAVQLFVSQSFAQVKKAVVPAVTKPKPVTLLAGIVMDDIVEKKYPNIAGTSLAPDVVSIDADVIQMIVNGKLIISKGKLDAMIDLDGKFIVPYGKYKFIDAYRFNPVYYPLFAVEDIRTGLRGFINGKGEVVVPAVYEKADGFSLAGIATLQEPSPSRAYRFVDIKGHEVSNRLEIWPGQSLQKRSPIGEAQSELFPFRSNAKMGYLNRFGTVKIPAQFNSVNFFTDGMAAVKNIDEFGEEKWGYIDETGKLVIPYMFKREPGYFHEGLALVRPSGPSTFDYAYIDKTGKVQFTIGDGKNYDYKPLISSGERFNGLKKDSDMGGNFIRGFALWSRGAAVFMLDHNGNFLPFASLIKVASPSNLKEPYLDQYDERGIFFGFGGNARMGSFTGLVDYKGNLLLPPLFDDVYKDYYSKYSLVKVYKGRNSDNSDNIIEGIVNSQGVFVLVIGKKSVF